MNQNGNWQWGQGPAPEEQNHTENGWNSAPGQQGQPGQQSQPSDGWNTPDNGSAPPPPRAGQWSGINRQDRPYTDGWNSAGNTPGGPGGLGGTGYYSAQQGFSPFPSPAQIARGQLKSTVRRVVPALLILLLVEYIFAYGVSAAIDFSLASRIELWQRGFRFPDNTYFGMSYGLYDLLTSYLPVIVGEIAAIIFLRFMTKIPFRQLFGRPVIPENTENRYIAPGADLSAGSRHMPGGIWVLFAALAGIGFSMIGQIFAILELNFLDTIGFPYYSPDFSTVDYTLLETVLINLYVCVFGPILEELIFRGFMLRSLQKHGVSFAAVFTAILFTLYHMNLVQLCVPLLVGLFLALLTIRTDSLIPAICCHILNNTIATLGDYLMPNDEIWSWVYLIVECAIFIGILAIFWIYYGRHFSPILRWKNPDIRLSSQLGAAVASWPTVVFICIYFLMLAASTLMTMMGG